MITPNYAGSGGTPLPTGELTLDLLADQVAATFGGPADLVGFSLGAVVAAAVAARHPGRVSREVRGRGSAGLLLDAHMLRMAKFMDLAGLKGRN
ncbi:alpha/beta fold hydrolase [Streptosporangium carneum]|uniref:alpha/beta fold hydrolase n=1 Tax=Streptosporangium carneum TaxID=47481 RepID=UPI0022F33D29|nr:hypothetical protein [Streptosporangium carneum]